MILYILEIIIKKQEEIEKEKEECYLISGGVFLLPLFLNI
jgi:hypothetical protein